MEHVFVICIAFLREVTKRLHSKPFPILKSAEHHGIILTLRTFHHQAHLCTDADLLAPGTSTTTIPDRAWTAKRVFGKSSSESLLAADLLASNEAVNGHRNGAVDVMSIAVLAEAHLRERLANTKN